MDRRRHMRTDESATSELSITSSVRDIYLGIQKYIFGDEEMSNAKSEVLLNRMLSTKSAISTGSSLAEANQRAHDDACQQVFPSIGKGQCGTIYALTGTTMVIKLPNSSEKSKQLFKDFQTHTLVEQAFQNLPNDIRYSYNIKIPEARMWVNSESNHFWSVHAPFLKTDIAIPNYALISERIYPLPLPVRKAIVDALCSDHIKARRDEFLSKPENKDCLVRLYLGRRDSTSSLKNFGLRNFPLHVNQMEYLQLDTKFFAKTIAQALAVLHWSVGVDANDVEFALGSTPEISIKPTASQIRGLEMDAVSELYYSDFKHRTISVWLLDFNQCAEFSDDATGMKKLVDGFWWNDPYYPRPNATNSKDKELWNVFSKHYLEIGAKFNKLGGPEAFIQGVVDMGQKRCERNLFG